MQHSLAYRDGAFMQKSEIHIGLDDLGFERGFAVFDYCRVRNGEIPFLKDHLQRLNYSQSILRLEKPVEMQKVREIIEQINTENALKDSYFKMIISARLTENKTEGILTVFQDVWKAYDAAMYINGIALILQEYEKPFPEYKTTFYLGSLREHARMIAAEAEDILFYAQDVIRESSRCNIFIVKNGLIYTPYNNILKGVTRQHVINSAGKTQMVIEKDISVRELLQADEVFISSTTRNIMPVIRIEDQTIGAGKPGPVTMELMMVFENYCLHYGTD